MPRPGLSVVLILGLAAPALAAEFDPSGADLTDFKIEGVMLGDGLSTLQQRFPDVQPAVSRHPTDPGVVTGTRFEAKTEMDGHLTAR